MVAQSGMRSDRSVPQPEVAAAPKSGESLAARLERETSLTLEDALQIASGMASELVALHARAAVHGDLTPRSVYLDHGSVRLLRVGIPAAEMPAPPAEGSLPRYDPRYGAPERADGCGDIRSDLYSLGIMLYQMICGQLPVQGETPVSPREQRVTARPRMPPRLPVTIWMLMGRCLATDPAKRFATPDELAAALEQATSSLDRGRARQRYAAPPISPAPTSAIAPSEPAPEPVLERAGGDQESTPATDAQQPLSKARPAAPARPSRSGPPGRTGALPRPREARQTAAVSAGPSGQPTALQPSRPAPSVVAPASTASAVPVNNGVSAGSRSLPDATGSHRSFLRRAVLAAAVVAILAAIVAGTLGYRRSTVPPPPTQAEDVTTAPSMPPIAAMPTAEPDAAQAPSGSPVTPSPPAVVSGLVVCDDTVDCAGTDPTLSRKDLLTCLRVPSGGSGRALVLVATERDQPPASADSPSIVARSDAVSPSPAFACHTVRLLNGALRSGTYWIWVLDGPTALARLSFVVDPGSASGR